MPIYEYKRPDGTTFEVQQAFSDDPLTVDPETGVAVERVLHAPAVHFKGKGFYNTDYGTRKRQRENAASASEGSSAKEDSSSGEKADAGKGDSKESQSSGSDGGAKDSKPAEKAAEAPRSGTSKPVAAAK